MTLDLSEFEGEAAQRRQNCFFVRTPFTDDQRAKLAVVLDQRPDISHRAISRVLAKWNYKISDDTVAHHRQRVCSCPKPERS